jgi:hypothetical protein
MRGLLRPKIDGVESSADLPAHLVHPPCHRPASDIHLMWAPVRAAASRGGDRRRQNSDAPARASACPAPIVIRCSTCPPTWSG